jgi:hypothetical protein
LLNTPAGTFDNRDHGNKLTKTGLERQCIKSDQKLGGIVLTGADVYIYKGCRTGGYIIPLICVGSCK